MLPCPEDKYLDYADNICFHSHQAMVLGETVVGIKREDQLIYQRSMVSADSGLNKMFPDKITVLDSLSLPFLKSENVVISTSM